MTMNMCKAQRFKYLKKVLVKSYLLNFSLYESFILILNRYLPLHSI